MRIEICGGIAAGKTTLARLLTRLPARGVLEQFKENPFWKAFYTEPGKHVFETELTFLLQHYHAIRVAQESGSGLIVSDHGFVLDAAYADIGLFGSRRHLFEAVMEDILAELGPPDLVVFLMCDPATELKRIHARSRKTEASITSSFLAALSHAIENQVQRLSPSTHVVRINSGTSNFATNRATRLEVLNLIKGSVSNSNGSKL